MTQARSGDTVRVHYTGRLQDGAEFDSSRDRQPIEFQLGAGQVIRGFDDAVAGMQPGDEQTITVAAEDAYGAHRDELVFRIPRDQIPAEIDPQVGQQLQMAQGDNVSVVTIRQVTEDAVQLDANHPLAGEELTFDLKLVEIV